MVRRRLRLEDYPGPRHAPGRYDQRDEAIVLAAGDRIFIPCEGGPSRSRLELFPPRLEIDVDGGLYVLDDGGPRTSWRYVYVEHP